MGWHSSTRRQRLPSDWPRRRAAVKARAAGMCEQCGHPGSECDHVTPGDNHDLTNLQWLCRDCHRAKTNRENAARNKALPLRHRSETHPGIDPPRMPPSPR